MTPFEADADAMAGLKDFQRNTARYVLRRLYDDADCTDRFLVADEVGMGKTLVARAVIAGVIERLERDPAVHRIDVIYICSNADIARQNLDKLGVSEGSKPISTRVTMLATQLRDLNRVNPQGRKTVNLVAFTPGTSFDAGHRGGRVEERALLAWMVEPLLSLDGDRAGSSSLHRILRMGVQQERWNSLCEAYGTEAGAPDRTVTMKFRNALVETGLLARLREAVDHMRGKYSTTHQQWSEQRTLVADLRRELAKVSVESLEPDLIILDEFQRFKHLLNRPDPGAEAEVSELAHVLFNYPGAKVLLLSATPYKMYTLSEERELTGDDHYGDFISTIDFLDGSKQGRLGPQLRRALQDFRSSVVAGTHAQSAKEAIEQRLRRVMSRTERPVGGATDMFSTLPEGSDGPTVDDLVGYVALNAIAKRVDGKLSVEYWKSAPYFLNFMDGYQLSSRFHEANFEIGERARLLKRAQVIRRSEFDSGDEIEPGNARLRRLCAETLDRELWRLLWLPASMPYYQPSGVYERVDRSVTKRLIFSSWAAAPSAIAAILSRNAEHRMKSSGPIADRARLTYSVTDGKPSDMTTLMLFVPTPALAELTDSLSFARQYPTELLTVDRVVEMAMNAVLPQLPTGDPLEPDTGAESWYWTAPFLMNHSEQSSYQQLVENLLDEGRAQDDTGLATHLAMAEEMSRGPATGGTPPGDLLRWVALVGLASPANVAWRSLRRLTTSKPNISTGAVHRAAALIGAGFRSLFNRPEVMTLVSAVESDSAYWRSVLRYCLAGNLQAVMDEYVHHLGGNSTIECDDDLVQLGASIRSALALRAAPVLGTDPFGRARPLTFTTRFAARYGTAKGTLKTDDQSISRLTDLQAAFNSPFWPMVLASTSVGQEGIDFHWWCHSIVHWNLPSNPADFEQREGRVHRFKGHAVRKNVALDHREAALRSSHPDPWKAAFEAADKSREPGMNDLWPWWTYPGEARIQRSIPSFPFSRDESRAEQLQRMRGLYRLAFGQPRQEDLLSILVNSPASVAQLGGLNIDLRPPTESADASTTSAGA